MGLRKKKEEIAEGKKGRMGRRHSKKRIVAQVLVSVLLIVCFVGSAVLGAGAAFYTSSTKAIKTDSKNTLKSANVNESNLTYDQDVVNLLLIGCDKRKTQTVNGLSDSTMIATIDLKNGKLKLTSLMRDMYLDIPGYGQHKFNAAYSYGGVQLEYETIAENFGIKLDGYVEVDMEGFRKVIDLLGGVPMQLTEGEAYYLQTAYRRSKHGEKEVVAGDNVLTPYQALAYCRIRQDVSGEYGRTDRQRKVIISLFNQIKGEDLMTITNVAMKALKYIHTDLTEKQIRSLMNSVIAMGTTDIQQLRIPISGSFEEGRLNGTGAWVIQVDLDKNKQALNYFLFGKGTDPGVKDEYGVGNDHFIEGYYPDNTAGLTTY
ncbi:MAG: LCP family protein [Lachnospiraceae bacterium]|nr:LCP family protein [Lachnospiraceae bacterium]